MLRHRPFDLVIASPVVLKCRCSLPGCFFLAFFRVVLAEGLHSASSMSVNIIK